MAERQQPLKFTERKFAGKFKINQFDEKNKNNNYPRAQMIHAYNQALLLALLSV